MLKLKPLVMKSLRSSLGIDVSKDDCKCNLCEMTEEFEVKVIGARTFPNTEKGLSQLFTWLTNKAGLLENLTVVIEASGVYYERFAFGLQKADYRVSVVLPNKAKKYMESLGIKTKNDHVDAKGLARMGCEQRLEEWSPLSPFFHKLRGYCRLHEDIQNQRTQTLNQLHALKHSSVEVKEIVQIQEQLLVVFEKQLKELKKLIKLLVESNKEVKERMEKICKIQGVGLLTVATLSAETNGFALIQNIPQLVSYAGYDVIEDQSGKRVGKTRISKQGNSHIRRALHMPGLLMKRYEVAGMHRLYERTFSKHGIKMKSYVAVQRKLLVLIYTLWKKNEVFDNNYNKIISGVEKVVTPLGADSKRLHKKVAL